VRRFGIGVLGSPLAGWTTSYQGFNLEPGLDPVSMLPALLDFASELGCRHVEVMDRRFGRPAVTAAGWEAGTLPGWELDLTPTPDELLAATTSSCRWGIRKAERNGLVVVDAAPEGFAETYHGLLREVFARRGATLTYSQGRVQALVDHLFPTGQLLLLTVHQDDGPAIAAGVFPGAHGAAYYWGGASRTEAQRLLPNEAMLWAAVTRWRDRGARSFDFGGGGPFKEKFGGTPIEVAWARRTRPALLGHVRGLAGAIARRSAK
jgi:hypothetical protein